MSIAHTASRIQALEVDALTRRRAVGVDPAIRFDDAAVGDAFEGVLAVRIGLTLDGLTVAELAAFTIATIAVIRAIQRNTTNVAQTFEAGPTVRVTRASRQDAASIAYTRLPGRAGSSIVTACFGDTGPAEDVANFSGTTVIGAATLRSRPT